MAALPVGISTSWNAVGVRDGWEIVRQVKRLGFGCLEVEYRVSEKAAADIEEAVRTGEIRVLSVHNYTPLEAGEQATSRGGDKRNLASPEEAARKDAVRLTLRSLDLGRRLGARAVVLHLGETVSDRAYFGRLVEIVEREGVSAPAAVEVRKEVMAGRNGLKRPYLEAALRSLEDLLPYAEAAGMVLGLENRYYPHQIPLPEEIPPILQCMNSPHLRYWHDIGHAHVMHILGFDPPAGEPVPRIEDAFGVHIHDAVSIRDHKAPGSGNIALAPILRRIPAEAVKIVELGDQVPESDVARAVGFLRSLGMGPA
jgi:sugar phosphate isomerase/epimerase